MLKRPKLQNLLDAVRSSVDSGHYFDTRHATDRQAERSISRTEILYVLKNGRHEKSKDQYQERYQAWNYAIRGRTIDKRDVRIIVSFDENNMLIITAIELGAEHGKKN